MRFWMGIAASLIAAAAVACTDSPTQPSDNSSRIFVNPGSLSFTQIGATGTVTASFQGSTTPPPDYFWHFTSTNPTVAALVGDPQSPRQTIAALANGSATIHVTLDTVKDTADIPVTVNAAAQPLNAYNGTYKGDANLTTKAFPGRLVAAIIRPLQCTGSQSKYGETMVVNVNASGAGSMTMQDTANFERAYQGTLAADLTFSGSGTFSFLGTPVPGQLKVTITDPTHLTFEETTTYGSCSNTYNGTLTKQ